MSLRRSLSLLLRTQALLVPKKSVHSVAVIGAPFSRGQVRTGTWHLGAGFPPPHPPTPSPKPGEIGTGGKNGEARRGWGETKRGRGGGFPRLGTGGARGIFLGRRREGMRAPGLPRGQGAAGWWGSSALPPRSEKVVGSAWGDGGEERRERISWRGWKRRNRPESPVEN